jgi:hypothetical protein
MTSIIVYHYSNQKFTDFDDSKCDWFWFTDISPENQEFLNEIGSTGAKFCAKCEISLKEEMRNGKNTDVFEQLDSEGCDLMINIYDGFIDYAARHNAQIKIIEWIEL